MAFKEYDRKPTFVDMEIQRGFENSRNRQILPAADDDRHIGILPQTMLPGIGQRALRPLHNVISRSGSDKKSYSICTVKDFSRWSK